VNPVAFPDRSAGGKRTEAALPAARYQALRHADGSHLIERDRVTG
jgi:hypothetical protein